MSDLIGNPKERFSRAVAHIKGVFLFSRQYQFYGHLTFHVQPQLWAGVGLKPNSSGKHVHEMYTPLNPIFI